MAKPEGMFSKRVEMPQYKHDTFKKQSQWHDTTNVIIESVTIYKCQRDTMQYANLYTYKNMQDIALHLKQRAKLLPMMLKLQVRRSFCINVNPISSHKILSHKKPQICNILKP